MEVRPESGVAGREPFGLGGAAAGIQKSPPPQPTMQSMRLAFTSDGTAIYKPISLGPPPSSYPPASVTPPPPPQPVAVTSAAAAGCGGPLSLPGGSTLVVGSSSGGSLESGSAVNSGTTALAAAQTVGIHGLSINMSEPLRRKRGRPRKYGPDGTISLALTSPMNIGFSTSSSGTVLKKQKPRLSGSAKKVQLDALGSSGIGFTPHVITVKAGEDVSSKIMSFSQHGPRAICILSANGAISNVTLRQAATSGGTVTYEGRFEILSLSGSFLLSENGGQRSRTGGLSVSLAGPDGRVLGGGVAGLLTAASPVQVVVGSFISDGKKEPKPANPLEPVSAPAKLVHGGPMGPSSSPSRGTHSGSSGGPGSPLNQSTGGCNNSTQQGLSNIPWK